MPQLFIDITFPTGVPTVDRTFQLRGNISWSVPSNWTNISKNVSVQLGRRTAGRGRLHQRQQLAVHRHRQSLYAVGIVRAADVERECLLQADPDACRDDPERLDHVHGAADSPIAPTIGLAPFASPIVATQVPVDFMFTGRRARRRRSRSCSIRSRAASSRTRSTPAATGRSSTSGCRCRRRRWPRSRAHHSRDRHVRDRRRDLEVLRRSPQPPIVVPPGSDTTFTGAPTTSSITSWTRLEPQSTDADIGTSSSARACSTRCGC